MSENLENRISSTQAKDAIFKMHNIQSSASEIDGSIKNKNLSKISFIGDSRCWYGSKKYYKNATTTDYNSINMFLEGCGIGITSDSSGGILNYRASDKSFSWTAPNDTQGEYLQITRAGRVRLESGSENKWIELIIKSFNTLPTTDKIVNVSVSGVMSVNIGNNPSMSLQVQGLLEDGSQINLLGVGGATTSNLLELQEWINEEDSLVGGVDIIRIGTNDISSNLAANNIIANAVAFFTNRLKIGRKLVICGESARWGTSVGTPLTSTQLESLLRINEAYFNFCQDNDNCIFVDLYSLSANPNFKDGRPTDGILKDTVHDDVLGSLIFGNAIYESIKLFGTSNKYPLLKGDFKNLYSFGDMSGTSGTIQVGASGTAPTGTTISRASGSDATVVASILSNSSPSKYGVKLDITGVTLGNIIQVRLNGIPLSSVGLASGDIINFISDIEIHEATNIVSIDEFVLFNDALSIKNYIARFPLVGAYKKIKSNDIVVPLGATSMTYYLLVKVGHNSTATIELSNIRVVKKEI